MTARARPADRTPGVIRADEAYTLPEFRRRAGLGDYAMRQLRREGLPIIEIGRKRYIRGADWLEYLARAAAEQRSRVEQDAADDCDPALTEVPRHETS